MKNRKQSALSGVLASRDDYALPMTNAPKRTKDGKCNLGCQCCRDIRNKDSTIARLEREKVNIEREKAEIQREKAVMEAKLRNATQLNEKAMGKLEQFQAQMREQTEIHSKVSGNLKKQLLAFSGRSKGQSQHTKLAALGDLAAARALADQHKEAVTKEITEEDRMAIRKQRVSLFCSMAMICSMLHASR
jgi:hypothetical protein